MDGKLARMLGADSKFGAQLDSLADLVSFGIAPSVLVYMWTLNQAGGAGWTIALVYLRLLRHSPCALQHRNRGRRRPGRGQQAFHRRADAGRGLHHPV